MIRRPRCGTGRGGGVALAAAAMVAVLASPLTGQSSLDRGPNVDGPWVSDAGVAHFHVVHRFWVTDPPTRKVINIPTFLVAAGLGADALIGARYGSNSSLVPGEFNEWEAFARWAPISEEATGLADVAASVAWNGVAESVDGELTAARSLGPARLVAVGRVFSAFAGGDSDVAVGGGLVWRVHRNVALAGDLVTLTSTDTTAAWGAGLQLRIPTTPHTVSLHITNANMMTLQSSSFGGGQQLYGFEFTIPITLSRYFGGRAAEPAPSMRDGLAPSDTAVVGMDNRLRFLPDTVRIRPGEAVRWENSSDLPHTVTADPAKAALQTSVRLPDGASAFDSGSLAPGGVYVRVFDVPGTYKYFCIPHERAGMVGWVIVED